ncbi:MAG: beta-N-acetylhexosaminidase [Bacteroidales bacterium]|nr:beta-N-acetylhexosaminidase [Bacteroidales bacterium]
MLSRRLIISIAVAAALLAPQLLSAQTTENKFDKHNPYTQLIPQPTFNGNLVGEKAFVLDKNTVIIADDKFLGDYLASHIKNLLGKKPKVIDEKLQKKYKYKNAILLFHNEDFDDGHLCLAGCSDEIIQRIKSAEKKDFYNFLCLDNVVIIDAKTYGGFFNGIQTLLQLLPPQVYNFENKKFIKSYTIPANIFSDCPEFSYRGFELDVSRTWRPAEDIYKVLDWMAYHKLNKFHWHLTDDQGWRVEIKSLPLLTEKGAWRGPGEVIPSSFGSGNKRYGGFYTQQEIKDIVKYAAERNIEIIPEIETPGHSAAIAASYPEILCEFPEDTSVNETGYSREIWCVAKESNYEIIEKIIKEMAEMFPSGIINMGGDEVNRFNWEKCPDCQALMKKMGMTDTEQLHFYFVSRVNQIAKKYGKKIAGWEEIMYSEDIKDNSLIYVWHSKKWGPMAVQNGFDCVMQAAEYVYLDMQQSPLERGHNWARVIPLDVMYSYDPIALAAAGPDSGKAASNLELAKRHVVGIQAGLWEELGNRPENFVEYQMFPRICALAETGWGTSRTIADSAANYKYFYDRLTQAHFARLMNMGIRFRVPYPEVKAERVAYTKTDVLRDESYMRPYKITVTPPYEGAVVRYAIVSPWTATDGIRGQKDTTNYKYVYTEPIITKNIANYRFATFASDTLHSIGVAVSNVPLQPFVIQPHFTVETNMKVSEKNLSILKEYQEKKYCRFEGRAKAGDYITFIFDEPVECSVIDILTGRSNVDFYGLTEGYAEYSEDGVNYKGKAEVDCSRIVLTPNTKVKSVRITVTGESDAQNFYLTPLKIY